MLATAVRRRAAAGRPRSEGRVLARTWDPRYAPPALPEHADWSELRASIKRYDDLPATASVEARMAELATISGQVGVLRAAETELQRPHHRDVQRLGPDPISAADKELRTEALRNIEVWNVRLKQLAAVLTSVRQEEDVLRYGVQKGATAAAFMSGGPRYLNITPDAGSELATGSEGRYPSAIPLDQQYRLGASDFSGVEVGAAGAVLDMLVVSGGHGGVGALFEKPGGGHRLARWWTEEVKKLADKGVRAKLIVLDACLTASILPAFIPLLAPGGKLVGYVHSIPQMAVTADLWTRIAAARPEAVEAIVDERLQELVALHAASRGAPFGSTIAIAIYREDRGQLFYDDAAVGDELVSRVADKEESSELKEMKVALNTQKAQPLIGYEPSIAKPEAGTKPVVDAVTVTRAKLTSDGWLDDAYSVVSATSDLAEGKSVYTPQGEEWKIVAVAGEQLTIEKG
jgi:hypothetical protein